MLQRKTDREPGPEQECLTCRICRMRPPADFSNRSGQVPRDLRPPYCLLMSPTPNPCRKYTFRAMEAAAHPGSMRCAARKSGCPGLKTAVLSPRETSKALPQIHIPCNGSCSTFGTIMHNEQGIQHQSQPNEHQGSHQDCCYCLSQSTLAEPVAWKD